MPFGRMSTNPFGLQYYKTNKNPQNKCMFGGWSLYMYGFRV